MLAAAIIVFREIIEAGLIVGIMLAVTQTIQRANLWIGLRGCRSGIFQCGYYGYSLFDAGMA